MMICCFILVYHILFLSIMLRHILSFWEILTYVMTRYYWWRQIYSLNKHFFGTRPTLINSLGPVDPPKYPTAYTFRTRYETNFWFDWLSRILLLVISLPVEAAPKGFTCVLSSLCIHQVNIIPRKMASQTKILMFLIYCIIVSVWGRQ